MLALNPGLRLQALHQKEQKHQQQLSQYLPGQPLKQTLSEKLQQTTQIPGSVQSAKELKKELLPQIQRSFKESKILEILLNPERKNNAIDHHLVKKKKQKRQSHHL